MRGNGVFSFKFISLGTMLILLCSCQAYKSNGRTLFENAAPSQVSGTQGSSQFPLLGRKTNPQAKDDFNCWSQPKNEPLWFAKENTEYQVHFIDDQSIEVCFEDSETSLASTTN
jgi:hypothetical protein